MHLDTVLIQKAELAKYWGISVDFPDLRTVFRCTLQNPALQNPVAKRQSQEYACPSPHDTLEQVQYEADYLLGQ